jgi:hypothetical protein
MKTFKALTEGLVREDKQTVHTIHGTAKTYDPKKESWAVDQATYKIKGSVFTLTALKHGLKKLKDQFPHHKEHEVSLKESEQLDEISQGLATKVYKARVGKMARALKKGDEATAEKHFNKSQQTADRMSSKPSFDVKKGIRDLSEESEQLDEISKSLSLAVGKKRLEQGQHFQNAVSKWGLNLKHSKMYAKKADEYFGKSKKAYEYAFNKGVTKGKELEESAWDTYRRQALTEASLNVKTLSAEEIAQKHGVSLDTIKDQIAKGIRVEHEHATSDQTAEEIARDHLGERPDYYEKLDKANLEEADLKAQWNTDFTKDSYARRKNLSRTIKQQLNPKTPGLGNKAWKRADKEERENRKSTVSASLHEESDHLAQFSHHWAEFTKHNNLSDTDRTHLTQRNHHEKEMNKHYKNLTTQQKNALRLSDLKEDTQYSRYLQHHNLFRKHEHLATSDPSHIAHREHHRKEMTTIYSKMSPEVRVAIPKHLRLSESAEESATTSTSGMSFKEAIAHATKHGGKIVFGTNSQKWHSISPQDRDYNMPHASDPQDAQKVGEKQAMWGVRSVARSIVNRKPPKWRTLTNPMQTVKELHDEPDRPGTGIGVSGDGTEKGMAMTEDGPSKKKTISKADWDHHTRHATAQFDTDGQRWIVQQDATGAAVRIPVTVTEDYPYRQTIRRILREAFPMAPKSTEKPDNTQDDEEQGEAPKVKKEKAVDPVVIGKTKDKFEADPVLTPVLSVANMPGGSVR